MTLTGYLIWIVAMAIMIIVVLTVGTLAAADVFGDSSDAERREPVVDDHHEEHEQRAA